MDIINYTDARKQLKGLMERVCVDHAPVAITRQGAEPVVVMSLAEYQGLEETAYLLRSEANRKRLYASLEAASKGKWTERPASLVQDEAGD